MTRVVIHIGAGKCGSSAMQQYLKSNRKELLAAGVLVPDKDAGVHGKIIGEQVWFFERLRELPAEQARAQWSRCYLELLEYADKNNVHTVVISAENLINPTGTAYLLGDILQHADVQILCYVRRQLDYLVSAWQQWYLKIYQSPQAFLDENLGAIADWNLCLASWEEVFGSQPILLRRYERNDSLAGDVVQDCLQALGLADQRMPMTAGREVNPSYSDAMTAAAMCARDQFSSMHDNGFYLGLQELVGELAWRRKLTAFPFSSRQVESIERTYAQGNAALREKYFVGEPGDLFRCAAEDGVLAVEQAEIAAQLEELIGVALTRIDMQEPAARRLPEDFPERLRRIGENPRRNFSS
jgi:hypothetical protein